MFVEQEITGIVLKSFLPYKNKLSVLTRSMGKINLICNPEKLRSNCSSGTSIKFFCSSSLRSFDSKAVFTSHIERVDDNIDRLKKEIYWLHHILEICYFFVPLGVGCPDVFRLVEYCFALCERSQAFEPNFFLIKKLCLVRLFILIGFYPEQELFLGDTFNDMVAVSLDSTNTQKVRSLSKDDTILMIRSIDAWLLACLQEHPHIMNFKTVSFFDKM